MGYKGSVELKASEIKRKTVTGSTSATHVLTWTAPSEQALIVTINGVKQHDSAYTISGTPTTVTLDAALVSSDELEVIGINDVGQTITPAEGSVTNAHIDGGAAIATSKISGLAASATTDTTSASNITSGTLPIARIADNAITLAKQADGTQGGIVYYGASGAPTELGVGTSGQALLSGGAGANLSWGTGGVSALSALSDATVSSSDPTVSSNPSAVGHLWLNSTSGEGYIATDITAGSNIWVNIGDGSGSKAPLSCQYLVIAGGGAGGGGSYGSGVGGYRGTGGGGAGGYRSNVAGEYSGGGSSAEAGFYPDINTAYSIIVGAGGSGASLDNETSGSNSKFNIWESIGGGYNRPNASTQGTGGSGGGAAYNGVAGAGTTGQGYAGGGGWSSGNQGSGGGGGGAGSVGQDSASAATTSSGGDGGTGVASTISGSSVYRGGGGGGGHGGTGGNGGGGNAPSGTSAGSGNHGTVNTGGGGSGAAGSTNGGAAAGGNGGAGVVFLKIEDTHQATFTGGVTSSVVSASGYRCYTVTATSSTSETVTFTAV